MLLRAIGFVLVCIGSAAAQTTPAPDRTARGPTREARADRAPRGAGADRSAKRPAAPALDRQAVRPVAQSPAERVSRALNRDAGADRFRDAASDARGDMRPTRPEVQQFDAQRRSLQPDVGRPEEDGRISPNTAPGVSGIGTQQQQ